jgi:hypothetical protein
VEGRQLRWIHVVTVDPVLEEFVRDREVSYPQEESERRCGNRNKDQRLVGGDYGEELTRALGESSNRGTPLRMVTS